MTFWQYLKLQQHRDDEIGDFARDAVLDATFPRRSQRRDALVRYLDGRSPVQGARLAFEKAHLEWRESHADVT